MTGWTLEATLPLQVGCSGAATKSIPKYIDYGKHFGARIGVIWDREVPQVGDGMAEKIEI